MVCMSFGKNAGSISASHGLTSAKRAAMPPDSV